MESTRRLHSTTSHPPPQPRPPLISAASEEALVAAEGAGEELCVVARDAVEPLWSDKGGSNADAAPTTTAILRRDLVETGVRRVRARRNALTAALAQARFETMVTRVHVPCWPTTARRRTADRDVEAGQPSPPPATTKTLALTVYLPASSRFVCAAHHPYPLAELASVEVALGRVAIALQAVAVTVKAGFGPSLAGAVRHRYAGRDPANSTDPLAALAACIVRAVDEAAALLRAAREAWRHGADCANQREFSSTSHQHRAYIALHDEVSWIVSERARIDASHWQTWHRLLAGEARPLREPVEALVRVSSTQERSLEHSRWLAFLWEVGEVDAALGELDRAVRGLAERVGLF